jgi:hypothetical protein
MSGEDKGEVSAGKLADSVAPSLDTLNVQCVAVVAERLPNSKADGKLSFTMSGKDAHWTKEGDSQLVASFPFEVMVEVSRDGQSKEDLAKFFLQYVIVYKTAKLLASWSDESLESFVARYGSTHVWPYLRADLQAMTAKVGLPALTLPPLKYGHLPAGFSISQHVPGSEDSDVG